MPIVDLFFAGQEEVINPLIDAGKIEIVATECVDNWKPDVAQSTMEQIQRLRLMPPTHKVLSKV